MKLLNNPTREGFIESTTKMLIQRNVEMSQGQQAIDDRLFEKAEFIKQYDLTDEPKIRRLLYVIDALAHIRERNIKRNRENPNSSFNRIFNPKK